MRWIVGVDFREQCQGALRMGRWIVDSARAADDDRLEAVHVLQDQDLRPLRSHVSLSEVERMARESFDRTIAGTDLKEHLSAVDMIYDSTAERGLTRRVGSASNTALVMGRRAPAGSRAWTRLGRVARRLVRTLPAPVVVVPPDFDPVASESGPIVLATNLEPDADGAATFAARLAAQWKRPLVVVHVAPGAAGSQPHYLTAQMRDQVIARHLEEGQQNLEIWLRRHDLGDADGVVVAGDTVDCLASIALERAAVMIVVGSRLLPLRSRIVVSSIGSDLAGTATVPVAVVPPPPS